MPGQGDKNNVVTAESAGSAVGVVFFENMTGHRVCLYIVFVDVFTPGGGHKPAGSRSGGCLDTGVGAFGALALLAVLRGLRRR